MKSITIFTPTFNRSYCLGDCYNSLVNQTCSDFLWLIIDDGSSDGTRELVDTWIEENKIDITYIYQDNQGMHGAHNTAYGLIKTELNVCIDSDDSMPSDAVEKILQYWKSNDKHDKIAGIVGLDTDKSGNIIGKRMPVELKTATLEDLYHKHKIFGDKKLVYRTDVVNKFKHYPLFEGERFVPLGILYLLIDKKYRLLCLNEPLCIVEYMPDGSSKNMMRQYYRHPRGFQYARKINMNYSSYFKVKMKNAIHYVSHSIQLRDANFFRNSPRKDLTLLALPLGFILYLYVLYFNRIKK